MKHVILFFFFLSILPLIAQQTTQFPETIIGKRAEAYISAFNNSDESAMFTFIIDNISDASLKLHGIDQRMKLFKFMKNTYQHLSVVKVHLINEHSLSTSVQAKNGEQLQFVFEFEENNPYKLNLIRVEMGDSKNEDQSEKVPEGELVHTLEKYLTELSQQEKFSGVVLIEKNNEPLFEKAYGQSNKENNTINNLETKFNLGSINKIFTKIAIAQLIEQGKLTFETKLGEILPNYPNNDAKQKVTIRHLLEMESGIGDFFGKKFEETPKKTLRTINDYLPLFANEPLAFEPGTSRAYSNGGFIVLGAIIEKLSGKSYYDYARENIFLKAGMLNTDSYETDSAVNNIAIGYIFENGKWVANTETRPAKGSSAGGGYSTENDLLKFTNSLINDTFLSYDYTEWILGGTIPEKNSLSTQEKKIHTMGGIGIAGGAPGINASLDFDIASGYAIVVLSNYSPPSAEDVAKKIRGWLGIR